MIDFEWHRRAQECLLHAALTNSKRPECFVKGVYPTHLENGYGSYVYDDKNKKYIDFICGLGTNLLGYANEHIGKAISRQYEKGAILSLSTTTEVKAAERLKEVIPFIDKLRFLKTGTEACAAAVKLARSFHGVESGNNKRSVILSEGYHGWSDHFVQLTPPHFGVVHDNNVLPLMDNYHMLHQAAAVIVEPVMTVLSTERISFLNQLRDDCTKYGTILIFDEIITGFRFPKYTVSNYLGLSPDIILLGKAIGGGFPLSAVGTNSNLKFDDKEWFVSSTFAGDTIALAAMLKVIDLLTNDYSLTLLWNEGDEFRNRFNQIRPELVTLEGYGTRGVFKGDELNKALFFQEACRAGILFGPSFFFNFGHIELKEYVLSSCTDILSRIKFKQVELEGEMPRQAFAAKVRGK